MATALKDAFSSEYQVLQDVRKDLASKIAASSSGSNEQLISKAQEKGLVQPSATVPLGPQSKEEEVERLVTQVLETIKTDGTKTAVFLELLEEISLSSIATYLRSKLQEHAQERSANGSKQMDAAYTCTTAGVEQDSLAVEAMSANTNTPNHSKEPTDVISNGVHVLEPVEEATKQLEKKDLQIQELNDLLEREKTNIATLKKKYEQKAAEIQVERDKQNFIKKVAHARSRLIGKQEFLNSIFVLVLLFTFNPLGVLIGCLSALGLEIKTKHLPMYVYAASFALQILPNNAGATMTAFIGSLLGIHTCAVAANRRTNRIKGFTENWLDIVTFLSLGVIIANENVYSTYVHLPCMVLAILTGVLRFSFKTCWYCILAAYCAIYLLSFLMEPILYTIEMPWLTLIIELRAVFVFSLIAASLIFLYMQEEFSQPDVITVKNCTVFKYVGSEVSFLWKDYGIELHIPANHALIEDIDMTVKVRGADEDFQIPNGFELVSAIYSISTSLPLPVEAVLRIQHCVPGAYGRLHFVSAHNGPPYEFQQVDGGRFSQYSCYGEIKVSEFSEYAIVHTKHAPTDFVAGVYSNGITASFVVTKNLEAHLRAVEEELNCKTSKYRTVLIDENIEEIEIGLDIPTQNRGWDIIPSFTPAVLPLKIVCDFQPGKAIPKISLEMRWMRSREPAIPTDVLVKVTGLERKLEGFNLPCGRRYVIPIASTPSWCTVFLRFLKHNIQYSQFGGRLNIDQDLLHVRKLLSNLNKNDLRDIGRRLGLSNDTVNNTYDNASNSAYCDDILSDWMIERDNVRNKGGATWENLKRALEAQGLTGHAAKILFTSPYEYVLDHIIL